MDLHLQNVRTGDTVRLAPDRTLIGTADHAEYPTAGGPYLAALVVQTPAAGWALFGLSDSPEVMFNRQPLPVGRRVVPKKGDLLAVGDERFTFLVTRTEADPEPAERTPPACFAYVVNPDGQEECRAVDHDLLFGRLAYCHVQLADTKLSRLGALLAVHGGAWYVHNLAKKVIGRNRKAVAHIARLADGDELLIGPLVVRIELRAPTAEAPALPAAARPVRQVPAAGPTDFSESTDDAVAEPEPKSGPDPGALRESAQRLEEWLKGQKVAAPPAKGGLGGWLSAQRDKLRRFWLDTPETTAARSLRAAGKWDEALTVLDRAVRVRPDSPELLRELYRLYAAAGLHDLCYRPLRHIEKLAEARGAPDAWVLEELARLCERLSATQPSMADRAIAYWTKLEAATGESRRREKADVLARRALREGGYGAAADD